MTAISAARLRDMIEAELNTLQDARVQAQLRSLLVPPEAVEYEWDYGQPGQRYVCWVVLRHDRSGTGVAHCEGGFGPTHPWGLVFLQDHGASDASSMGMDCNWYSTFIDACLESSAVTDLPIWAVFRTDATQVRVPISPEQSWEAVWLQIEELRRQSPSDVYACDFLIDPRRTRTL